MGKKFRILLAVFFVASLGAAIWLALRPSEPEPTYQGKPLSFWLEAYDPGNYKLAHPKGPPPPTRDEAGKAIREIGTNAIPTLLRMLQRRNSKFEVAFRGLLQKQHFIKIPLAPINRNFIAYRGFVALGPVASNAVPRLIEIFDRDHSAFTQQAVPAILGCIGPPAAQAIPSLLRGITHTNEIVRANSIFALRQIHAEANLVVPALTKCLNDPDILVRTQAARSLGAFGQDATSAVPALLELWRREPSRPAGRYTLSFDGGIVGSTWGTLAFLPVPDVVGMTRNALQSIDPEAAAKAGIK